MKTISVVCQKGGVGKTTTVINIASVLANKGFKILIIDTDPQGNVSTYLNQEKSNTDNTTTTDILDGEKNINPLKVMDNLYLIPSDIDIKKHNSEKIIGVTGSFNEVAISNMAFILQTKWLNLLCFN